MIRFSFSTRLVSTVQRTMDDVESLSQNYFYWVFFSSPFTLFMILYLSCFRVATTHWFPCSFTHRPHPQQWYSISLLFVANPPQFSPGVRASESSKIKLSIRPNKWFDSDENGAHWMKTIFFVYSSTCFASLSEDDLVLFSSSKMFFFLLRFALHSYPKKIERGIALILLISSRTQNTTFPLFMITPKHVESVRV